MAFGTRSAALPQHGSSAQDVPSRRCLGVVHVCAVLAGTLAVLAHTSYGVVCHVMLAQCPSDCFMMNQHSRPDIDSPTIIEQSGLDVTSLMNASGGCDERLGEHGYLGCQDHSFDGLLCRPWAELAVGQHHFRGDIRDNFCRSPAAVNLGYLSVSGIDAPLCFVSGSGEVAGDWGEVRFCTSKVVRVEGRIGVVVQDNRHSCPTCDVIVKWKDGVSETMPASRLTWVGSRGPCNSWCRNVEYHYIRRFEVCSFVGESSQNRSSSTLQHHTFFIFLMCLQFALCLPLVITWTPQACRLASNCICCTSLRRKLSSAAPRYNRDVCDAYYEAKASLIRTASKILIPLLLFVSFYTFGETWRQNTEGMSDWLAGTYPWEVFVVLPVFSIAEFFPEKMTPALFHACHALSAAAAAWRGVNDTAGTPMNMGMQGKRNSFFAYQTILFGNARLSVGLCLMINFYEALLRAWLEATTQTTDAQSIDGMREAAVTFGALAGFLLYLDSLKWQELHAVDMATKARVSSESLTDALADTLSDLCDFVVHLDHDLRLMRSCPRLSATLLLPDRFHPGASMLDVIANSDGREALAQKCKSFGTRMLVSEMIDANGSKVGVQMVVTTFGDALGRLCTIIGGSELGERDHPMPLQTENVQIRLADFGQDSVTFEHFSDNDLASISTGEAFGSLMKQIEPDQRTLARVIRLGLSEHWLLSANDLQVQSSEIIGRGGFGVVVKCLFRGTKAVLKQAICRYNSSLSGHVALCNEVRILRQIRHPHIILFFGAQIDAKTGSLALVLEYVGGPPMSTYVKSNWPLPASDRRMLYEGVLQALVFLHAHEPTIVHGDLSPGNVMICNVDGVLFPKIIDFGLSRLLERNVRRAGGTLQWMAPEVLISGVPSAASDMFSFGRLMFFAETRLVPCDGTSRERLTRLAHQQQVPDSPWPISRSGTDSASGSARLLADQSMAFLPEGRIKSRNALAFLRSSFGSGDRENSLAIPLDFSPDFSPGVPSRYSSHSDEVSFMMHWSLEDDEASSGHGSPIPFDQAHASM